MTGLIFGLWLWLKHATKLRGSTMSKREQARRSSSANECPTGNSRGNPAESVRAPACAHDQEKEN